MQGMVLGPQHVRTTADAQLAYVNRRRVELPPELQVSMPVSKVLLPTVLQVINNKCFIT